MRGDPSRQASLLLLSCALALFGLQPQRAAACTAPACALAQLLPTGGALPANAVEILWRESRELDRREPLLSDGGSASLPRLFQIADGARSELEISSSEHGGLVHLVPRVELEPGTTLELEYRETCRYPFGDPSESKLVTTTLTVAPSAPRPTALGSLRAEVKHGSVARGDCGDALDAAYADLTLDLSAQAQPYAQLLRYGLVIDGQPTTSYVERGATIYDPPPPLGESSLGRAQDRVFAYCGPTRSSPLWGAVEPGKHRVQLLTTLPDDSELRSDEIQIELRCPGAHGEGNEGGCSLASGRGRERPSLVLVLLGLTLVLRARRARKRPAQNSGRNKALGKQNARHESCESRSMSSSTPPDRKAAAHLGTLINALVTSALCATVACSSGREACLNAGGRCVLGGFTQCLKRGSQDCNPSQNPGGAFCCLEEPPACAGPDGAATIKASNYDQSCQTDSDCVAIGEGNACLPCELECKTSAIQRDAEAAYRSDVAKIGPTLDPKIRIGCNCPSETGPCCVDGQCRADELCVEAH